MTAEIVNVVYWRGHDIETLDAPALRLAVRQLGNANTRLEAQRRELIDKMIHPPMIFGGPMYRPSSFSPGQVHDLFPSIVLPIRGCGNP